MTDTLHSALQDLLQEFADREQAQLRAMQKFGSSTAITAASRWPFHLKTFDELVADELASIQAERVKDQARREHVARLARAREEGIREAGRASPHPLERAEARQKDPAPASRTPMKRAAIIARLGRRFPALASALNRGDEWATKCRVTGRSGWYYLESIEAECCARYGGPAPVAAIDMSPAGQLRAIGK